MKKRKTLERSKMLLTCEIAEVLGTSIEAAEAQVEAALTTRAKSTLTGGSARRMASDRNQILYKAATG